MYAKKANLIIVLLAMSFFYLGTVHAASLSSAKKLYDKKNYDQAVIEYDDLLRKNPEDELLYYNLACAQYSKGDYENALENFQRSLLTDNRLQEAEALYNIGNTKYRIAKSKEQTDLSSSVEIMREALEYYKRSIDKNDRASEAKFNHEFVEKELKNLLDELKKQQEQQKQQQQEKQEQSEDQNKQQEAQQQQTEPQQSGQSGQDKSEEEQEQRENSPRGSEEKSAQESENKEQEESEQKADQEQHSMPMTKEQAENMLEKFSMQESDEFLKPKTDLKRRTAVYKDW